VVVPSITPEPFGRVAVEAMSRGKPVIGSRVGGLPEIIKDGDSGFLVAPGNASILADRLMTLERDRGLGEEMGWKGFNFCKQVFDQMSIVGQVVEAYDSILS